MDCILALFYLKFLGLCVICILRNTQKINKIIKDKDRILTMPCVIAIDGPSAAGKTTAAKTIASILECDTLDTGAMYRAAAWFAVQNGCDVRYDEYRENLLENFSVSLDSEGKVYVNGTDISQAIRSEEITEMASAISADLYVRKRLQSLQREWASARNMCVAEGRDMGTDVFPDAKFKFYLTASLEIRGVRRALETGRPIAEEMESLSKRDIADMTRQHSPLRKAYEAEEIDTSCLTIREVANKILNKIRLHQ